MLKVGDLVRVVKDTIAHRKGDMGVIVRAATLADSAIAPAYIVHFTAKITDAGNHNNPNRMVIPEDRTVYGKYLEKIS